MWNPNSRGRALGAALLDALARLAAARGAKSLTSDVSDTAKPLFERLGYAAQRRNLVTLGDEWLANTTMTKSLAQPAPARQPVTEERNMARERLYLFDTTLRDGALTTGVDFSLEDKRQIAGLLDELGVDYVEGGYPGANPTDTKFFQRKPTKRARFCAFGMTKRPGRSAANDPGVAGLLDADADAIVFVAKSWDYHVHVALGCTLEENLACIADSVARRAEPRAARRWSTASISSTATRPIRLMRWNARRTALNSGARWVGAVRHQRRNVAA